MRILHLSGTARVKDVPPDPGEYLALIDESYDHAVAQAPWHEEDLQRKLMPVQLRHGPDGVVMYMLRQELTGYGERWKIPDADYLFSRFSGWCPWIVGDVLVCGHDGSADTDVPAWCMPLEPGSRCTCGGRARGWRCDEGGQWELACSLHFGVFGDCGECDDKIPDFRNESCDCRRAPVGGHFVYPGRAQAWDRHRCMTCGPVGSVGDVADHCTENGLCSRCWGHGWIYDSGTPCHECGGPGTATAQRSFRRDELNDWRRRFPEADVILRDLHSQGLSWRQVGEPARIAWRVYEEGQPPGEEAARLVVDHHARGWPDKPWEEDEEPGPELLPLTGTAGRGGNDHASSAPPWSPISGLSAARDCAKSISCPAMAGGSSGRRRTALAINTSKCSRQGPWENSMPGSRPSRLTMTGPSPPSGPATPLARCGTQPPGTGIRPNQSSSPRNPIAARQRVLDGAKCEGPGLRTVSAGQRPASGQGAGMGCRSGSCFRPTRLRAKTVPAQLQKAEGDHEARTPMPGSRKPVTTAPGSSRPSATGSDCRSTLTCRNQTFSDCLRRNCCAWHADGQAQGDRIADIAWRTSVDPAG